MNDTGPPVWSKLTPEFRARLETRGIMIGLPCYGGHMVEATARSIRAAEAAFAERGIPLATTFVRNESHVERARNRIVAEFLASDCDQLVFIDADIGFHPDHLLRLCAHPQALVGGLYRKKIADKVDFAWHPLVVDGVAKRDPETGLVAAAFLATGFLKIRRVVFDRLREAHPELSYRAHEGEPDGAWREHLWTFFDGLIDPDTREWLSEDYAFCARWRALGGECWADPCIILQHYGQVGLWADPAEMMGAA